MNAKRLLSTVLSAVCAVSMVPSSALLAKADETSQMSIEECIKAGFENFDTEIDISGYKYTREDFSAIGKMINTIKEEPDMFYFNVSSLKCSMKYDEDGNLILSKIQAEYANDKQSAEIYRSEFVQKADEIINKNITEDMTDLEKALKLHDYIVLNTTYDLDNSLEDLNGGYSAYDVIVKNNGVCKGYAQAYKYLLGKVGVNSNVVISKDMSHGWNLVNIDDSWYHVDVTWDDPVPDTPGRVNHSYFMLSDDQISTVSENRKHTHYNWDSNGITADDRSYDNMFWNNVQTEIFISSGNWYFVNGNGEYTTYTPQTNQINTNGSLSEDRWYMWGEATRFWTGKYSSLIVIGDTVYYNTPQMICTMNLDGSCKKELKYVDPTANNGYMYGLTLKNNELYAVVKQSPSSESQQVKVDLAGKTNVSSDNISNFISVKGDITGDGIIDIMDLTVIAQYLLHDIDINTQQIAVTDINGNGEIDITDLAVIRQYMMNDITTLSVNK